MNAEQRPTKKPKLMDDAFLRELMVANESFMSLERKIPASYKEGSLCQKIREATGRLISDFNREMEWLEKEAGKFLRNLDDRAHDEDTVKGVIEAFPKALAQQQPLIGWVPIQKLLDESTHGYSFVPLLATEGRRLGIFSEEEKGGLAFIDDGYELIDDALMSFLHSDGEEFLRKDLGMNYAEFKERKSDENDTEFHALLEKVNVAHDRKTKKVLQKLFELNFFEKKDILDLEMVLKSSYSKEATQRMEFLLDLCPESLLKREFDDGRPYIPIQSAASDGSERGLGLLFKAGIKYYPNKLGFLFEKNGSSPAEKTIEMILSEEWMNLPPNKLFKFIHESISPSNGYPILHQVIKLAPKYFSLFWKYYPDAIYLRDKKGRLPLHIALQRACRWSPPLLSLIGVNDPIDRKERDPVNGLYPFMSAASGSRSDLDVVYYLLRRNPDAWEGFRSI